MKLENCWTNSARKAKAPFLSFFCFQSWEGGGEVGVRRLQGETNPAGRPKPEYLLLCSRFCLHADGLRRNRPPPHLQPPSSQALARAKKLSACWVCQPFWQEAFPSPPLVFLHPSFSWGGRAEGAQRIQMLMFHSESCTHIRLWLWFCSPVATERWGWRYDKAKKSTTNKQTNKKVPCRSSDTVPVPKGCRTIKSWLLGGKMMRPALLVQS